MRFLDLFVSGQEGSCSVDRDFDTKSIDEILVGDSSRVRTEGDPDPFLN